MREVRVLHEAAIEATEAADHYEAERPGLGQQFEEPVHDSLQLLSEDMVPLASISRTLTSKGIRQLIMRRFPYSIIVRRTDDSIEVVAFAHHARRPDYWRDRV